MVPIFASSEDDHPINILDYGCGSIDRVGAYWGKNKPFTSCHGTFLSRYQILAHILSCSVNEILGGQKKCEINGCDPFAVKETSLLQTQHDLEIRVMPEYEGTVPDIIVCFNPSPGILIQDSSYGEYISKLLFLATKMKTGSKIFIQIDSAFMENFPGTQRDSFDDQLFWSLISTKLAEIGIVPVHGRCVLGGAMDRYRPYESKLFKKVK